MTSHLAFFTLVCVMCISRSTPAVIPCSSGQKCNVMLGIPMTAELSSANSNAPIKYILPVTNMGQQNCSEERITPMGMIPLKNFELEVMPLRTYLQQYTLPSYVKFYLANSK